MHGSTWQSLRWYLFAAVMAALALAPVARAASVADLLGGSGSAAPAVTPPPTTAVEAIAPAEIPKRADADERFVQEVVVRARQQDPTAALLPELQHLEAGVRDLTEVLRRQEVRKLPVIRLESLERHWNFYDRQLADWRRQMQAVTARYSDDAAQLATLRARWEATRDAASLPPALSSRARVLAQQIATAEQAISGPLDEQLKLGRAGNALQASVDSGKQSIAAAIAYYDQRLYTIDVPPLWQLWSHPDFAGDDAVHAARVGLAIESDFLQEFTAANAGRLRFNSVLALLLLPVLLWLSWRSRKLVAQDDELKASTQVLTRPLSSWLVLVLVATPFLLPDAPLLLHQTALLLALIPVLRLLPRRVYAILGPAPYLITALYLLQRLGFLLIGHPLYFRLHLLGITVLTLAAFTWLLLSRRGAAPATVARSLRALGGAAVIGLLVSIIANLVGNLSLAEMITNGVIASSYLALALHAGATVLVSIVRLLLARKEIARFHVVTQRAGPLLQSLGRLIEVGALVVWVLVALNLFRVLRPVLEALRGFLSYPLEAGKVSVTAGSILLFVLSVWVAFWIARTIRAVLHDDVLPKMALPRGVGNSISTLSYYAMITVGLLIALAAAGFETSQFAIVFGALSLGIGFGLQNIVNNFVSGLILMFERPIQPGDVVEVSGTSGKVREIGMRATTLTTFEGADVVVPNGTLLSEKLINWTLSDMNRRIDVEVGVAYGSDPRQVMELLSEVARNTPGVASEPAPMIVFLRFGASSLDFAVRAWTNDFSDWVPIRSQLTIRVYDALQAAEIAIPFPQQDLHLRSVSPEAGAMLATGALLATGRPTSAADKVPANATEQTSARATDRALEKTAEMLAGKQGPVTTP